MQQNRKFPIHPNPNPRCNNINRLAPSAQIILAVLRKNLPDPDSQDYNKLSGQVQKLVDSVLEICMVATLTENPESPALLYELHLLSYGTISPVIFLISMEENCGTFSCAC